MKMQRYCTIMLSAIGLCLIAVTDVSAKWSFGVMGDNQQGANPQYSPSAITAITAKFIENQVKFVIQVGDQANANATADFLTARVALVQPLYDANIGYFPLRGNHEAFNIGGVPWFLQKYPQTRGGEVNTFGATNFNSPVLAGDFPDDLKGLSYSFDFLSPSENARFVLIDDQFTPNKKVTVPGLASYPYGYMVFEQQAWVSERLTTASRGTEHAFVFAHHNLIGENHGDCLFGFADNNPDGYQDLFFSSLATNGVRYFISGHEHVYNRSIVTSPDGNSSLMDIISSASGAKFIAPLAVDNAAFKGQKIRQTQVAQEYKNVGYQIYTIDGPRVAVDCYADAAGGFSNDFPITQTFNFVKKETFGYSLNGKEFRIAPGGSYNVVADNFCGTNARILGGVNDFALTDLEGRSFTKIVTTGWRDECCRHKCRREEDEHDGGKGDGDHRCRHVEDRSRDLDCDDDQFRSKIFTLWGMADFGAEETDVFTIEMSYRHGKTRHMGQGCFGIGSPDASGEWVNTVDRNTGGYKKFVRGPWKADYGLGTYGVDPCTKTIWAVVNHAGDFAAVNDIEEVPEQE